jgi:hypothetical protein
MPTRKDRALDFSEFPPGSVTEYTTLVCLACIFDIFTNQLALAARTAYAEVRRYAPSIEELTAPEAMRPFFDSEEKSPHCPYCNASKRWHARLDTFGIESGRAVDSHRRELMKSLPKKDEQFRVGEAKTERRQVFFAWLDTLRLKLDLESRDWLLEATRAYLGRMEPKTDWASEFAEVRSIRRSQRLVEGWEREGTRLFLSPALYGEVLVVQYLLSRSHAHGGFTFEGRLTLTELIRRLRYFGYLRLIGIETQDQGEILDAITEKLAGGTGAVKMYYLVDRREFLEKVKSVYAKYALK